MGVGLGGRGGNKDNTGIFLSFRKQQKKEFCRQILKFLADSAARGGQYYIRRSTRGEWFLDLQGGSFPPLSPPTPTFFLEGEGECPN